MIDISDFLKTRNLSNNDSKIKAEEDYLIKVVGIQNYIKARDDKTITAKLIDETHKAYYYSNYRYLIKQDDMPNQTSEITIRFGSIQYNSCTCEEFEKTGKCVHIAKLFFEVLNIIQKDPTLSIESYQDKITYSFLNEKIKQRLNLKIIFNVGYDDTMCVKLKIGDNKLFTVGSKLTALGRCINENGSQLSFGKNFTFDPNFHYFSEKDLNILNLLINIATKFSSSSRELPLTVLDTKNILNLLEDSTFDIEGVEKNVTGEINKTPIGLELNEFDGNYNFKFNYNNIEILTLDNRYMYSKNKMYILPDNIVTLLNNMENSGFSELNLSKDKAVNFSKTIYEDVKDKYVIDKKIENDFIILTPKVKIYFDLKKHIDAKVIFEYKNQDINFFDKQEGFRNTNFELKVIEDILSMNFQKKKNTFELTNINQIVDFIENKIYELKDQYEVFTTEKFDKTSIQKKTNISSHFSIGQDNIMTYNFKLDGIKPNELSNLFTSIKNKEKYYKLKNGKILDTEDQNIQELYEVCDNLNLDEYSSSGTIPKYRALYLDSVKNYNIVDVDNTFNDFVENFNKHKNATINNSKKDLNILRDYQKEGVKWLYNIYKCGFGGILADEMGLGKTIQTIMFLKNVLNEKPDSKILIVAPTSLIYNWEHEFDLFGSELDYKVIADSKAKRLKDLEDLPSISITTYGLLRQDIEVYKEKFFELVIIDEAQNIKNPNAGTTKSVKLLTSNTKLALTGTPVENSVLEVWSIFDYIMPGYLNSLANFQGKYNIKDMDEDAKNQLQSLTKSIAPFIQRRRKKDVLTDLPDKIENTIYLDLLPEQKKYYAAQVKKTKDEIDEIMETEGFQKARFKILQLLTKLRQLCIHPKIAYEDFEHDAVKITEIINLVNEYKQNGHKVLIFTSFRTALNIVKEEFDKHSISNYVIDGSVSSKQRTTLVDKFNTDDTNAFLITLKSGGTGLNLTSADVVIHLDLWWNPQSENQATDRAHRIGQVNTVEVVKLVCNGTIEERILDLQEKKKILNDALIDNEDISDAIFNKLDENDIRDLLSLSE